MATPNVHGAASAQAPATPVSGAHAHLPLVCPQPGRRTTLEMRGRGRRPRNDRTAETTRGGGQGGGTGSDEVLRFVDVHSRPGGRPDGAVGRAGQGREARRHERRPRRVHRRLHGDGRRGEGEAQGAARREPPQQMRSPRRTSHWTSCASRSASCGGGSIRCRRASTLSSRQYEPAGSDRPWQSEAGRSRACWWWRRAEGRCARDSASPPPRAGERLSPPSGVARSSSWAGRSSSWDR